MSLGPWNILLCGMASGDSSPVPICGKVITLDTVNNPEWNGRWEIVKYNYQPAGGESAQDYGSESNGEVTGSGLNPQQPPQGAGTLTLTLRTYNDQVFFDVSMTPSWVDVPGPWADGSY